MSGVLHGVLAGSVSGASDPYSSSVNFLLKAGVSDTITDASSNGFTITKYNNVSTSSAVAKFTNTYSVQFNGANQYFTAPDHASWDYPGDFTAEAWIYPTSTASIRVIVSNYNGTSASWWFRISSGALQFGNGDSIILAVSSTATASTWQHVAACRSGSDLRLFKDGTQVGSTTTFTTNLSGSSTPLTIGELATGIGQYFQGNIQDLRLTKGVARYTSSFTPPGSLT